MPVTPRAADFFVRMLEADFIKLPLRPLDAALDVESELEEMAPATPGAIGASLCGWAEWVSESTPEVSLGWDWISSSSGRLTVVPGSVRTNLMLVNRLGRDRGQAATTAAILRVLHRLSWQDPVLASLKDQPPV